MWCSYAAPHLSCTAAVHFSSTACSTVLRTVLQAVLLKQLFWMVYGGAVRQHHQTLSRTSCVHAWYVGAIAPTYQACTASYYITASMSVTACKHAETGMDSCSGCTGCSCADVSCCTHPRMGTARDISTATSSSGPYHVSTIHGMDRLYWTASLSMYC